MCVVVDSLDSGHWWCLAVRCSASRRGEENKGKNHQSILVRVLPQRLPRRTWTAGPPRAIASRGGLGLAGEAAPPLGRWAGAAGGVGAGGAWTEAHLRGQRRWRQTIWRRGEGHAFFGTVIAVVLIQYSTWPRTHVRVRIDAIPRVYAPAIWARVQTRTDGPRRPGTRRHETNATRLGGWFRASLACRRHLKACEAWSAGRAEHKHANKNSRFAVGQGSRLDGLPAQGPGGERVQVGSTGPGRAESLALVGWMVGSTVEGSTPTPRQVPSPSQIRQ